MLRRQSIIYFLVCIIETCLSFVALVVTEYCFHVYCAFFLLFITAAVGCDTKAALNYVQSLFHVEVFEHCLPPIILHHQLYSIVHSRTVVDKELVRNGSLFVLTETMQHSYSDMTLVNNMSFLDPEDGSQKATLVVVVVVVVLISSLKIPKAFLIAV